LNELYKRGYDNIWGFDVSQSGVEVAKKSFTDIQSRFTIHNGYETVLPDIFPLKDYDIVLSAEVIEHLYSPKTYLININTWLKQSGYLVLTTPYHGYFKNLAINLLDGFDKHANPLWEGGHIKFFSKKTILKILHESGFNYVKFYGSGRLPYLWKSMIIVARKI
jgi:2-polyprenyl-3-methyl-5-hydroxy-6-metoxy-1,4-benzoquinol methylase